MACSNFTMQIYVHTYNFPNTKIPPLGGGMVYNISLVFYGFAKDGFDSRAAAVLAFNLYIEGF